MLDSCSVIATYTTILELGHLDCSEHLGQPSNGHCGSATFECGGLVANGILGDVPAHGAEKGRAIQGVKSDDVGNMGQTSKVSSISLVGAQRCGLRFQEVTLFRQQSG